MSKKIKYSGLIFEDIIPLKKLKRSVADAKAKAKDVAIAGFDPFAELYQKHLKAAKAAIKSIKNEFSSKDDVNDPSKLTMSMNYIKEGRFAMPKDGILYACINIYMPTKKGFFGRFLSGSIGNWFSDVGVVALKKYVATFIGNDFAKRVSKDTVFNAVGEDENTGKTSYIVALKIGQAS